MTGTSGNAIENLPSSGWGIAIAAALLFLAFLPILLAEAKRRFVLSLAALLLCILSIAGLFVIPGLGIGAMLIFPLLAGTWFAGLICGLAAFLDAAAERRHHESIFRLIHGDARDTPVPRVLKKMGPPRQ